MSLHDQVREIREAARSSRARRGCARGGLSIARGEVKGLRDADARLIRFDTAIDTSIAALNALPAHCGPARDHRVREEEFLVYRVIGTIRAVKRAPDHDVHIILDDPGDPDLHVIVELPDPDSRGSAKSPYQDRLALAMQMFENLLEETGAAQWNQLRGVRVRVTGVGFFDLSPFQVGNRGAHRAPSRAGDRKASRFPACFRAVATAPSCSKLKPRSVMPRETTLDDLRRMAVTRSLGRSTTLARAIDALGFVQADPIRAPARAQDLTLRPRVRGYRAGDLERLYPSLDVEEDVFINYGFVTRSLHALMHPRAVASLALAPEHASPAVLAFVRERGAVHPRDVDAHFSHGRSRLLGGSSNATTHLLDALHYKGHLRVARREGGIRIYAPREPAVGPAGPAERRRAWTPSLTPSSACTRRCRPPASRS